jgi:hypothetical protein
MPRSNDPRIAERNQKLIDDYNLDRFQDYAVLGARYGVKAQLCYRILSDAGLTRSNKRKPRLKQSDRKPISNLHALLGSKVKHALFSATLDERGNADFQIGGYARTLKMSPQKLSSIFLGVEDMSLSDLMIICDKIHRPVSDFLAEVIKEERTYSVSSTKKLITTG